jgi:hypothetical protein
MSNNKKVWVKPKILKELSVTEALKDVRKTIIADS